MAVNVRVLLRNMEVCYILTGLLTAVHTIVLLRPMHFSVCKFYFTSKESYNFSLIQIKQSPHSYPSFSSSSHSGASGSPSPSTCWDQGKRARGRSTVRSFACGGRTLVRLLDSQTLLGGHRGNSELISEILFPKSCLHSPRCRVPIVI